MPGFACVTCGWFLYRTLREDGAFAPMRAPGSLRQKSGSLYLACPGCRVRIPCRSNRPGSALIKPDETLVRVVVKRSRAPGGP